jgi:hypothetical protein
MTGVPSGLSERQQDEADQYTAEHGLGYVPRVIQETVAGKGEWTANGHPLAMDPAAVSTDSELPAFLKPPKDAPVYYDFPLLSGVESGGFRLGMITDFILERDAVEGDLFIAAPDGSRAGVVWCTGTRKCFATLAVPGPQRWGIWQFQFRRPLQTIADAQWALEEMLPVLRPKWERWASISQATSEPIQSKRPRIRWPWRRS